MPVQNAYCAYLIDISHLVSCLRPAWTFFVILFLLHRFASLFSSPLPVFLWRKLIQKIPQKPLKKSRLFAYKFTVIFSLCHRILASALASQELFCQALPWQQLQLCLSPRRIFHNMRRLRNMALTVSFDVVTFHPGKIVLAEPETSGQPASGSFRACFHGSLLLLHASRPAPTLHRCRPRCLLKLNSIKSPVNY